METPFVFGPASLAVPASHNSTGDATTLFIDGVVTLTGKGTVALPEDTGGTSNNIIAGDPGDGGTLINQGNPERGPQGGQRDLR
jgi:hypothetical protein